MRASVPRICVPPVPVPVDVRTKPWLTFVAPPSTKTASPDLTCPAILLLQSEDLFNVYGVETLPWSTTS